jgi:hypothetical protein
MLRVHSSQKSNDLTMRMDKPQMESMESNTTAKNKKHKT